MKPPDGLRSSLTVFLVEDAAQSAAAFEVALTTIADVKVRVFPNAEDAIAAMQDEPFAALVTDVNLPGMDGLSLVSYVRSRQYRSRIPIVVISGDPHPTVPGRAYHAGADAFFTKPCSPLAVSKKLEELLYEK